MEADILGISPVAVWRHTSSTASASGRQNKFIPLKCKMRTGWKWMVIFYFLAITNKTTTVAKRLITHLIYTFIHQVTK